MSSDRIYLTKEEQDFLMDRLDLDNPTQAAEKFAELMVLERVDPVNLNECLRKVMKLVKEKESKKGKK